MLATVAVLAMLAPRILRPHIAGAHIGTSVDACTSTQLHVHVAFIIVVPILYCFSIPTSGLASGILLP